MFTTKGFVEQMPDHCIQLLIHLVLVSPYCDLIMIRLVLN